MGTNYVVASSASGEGKDLYYRLLSDTGVSASNKVGLIGGVCHSYNSVPNDGKFTDYSLTASDWTPLTADADGSILKLSSSYNLVSVMFKASSSATASFPVTVNARLQIGYLDT